MSSNVGLSTPRGSGTSGYVQRNYAFMKPRNAGYGAPYPPVSGANSSSSGPDGGRPFKQRQPDKQILEHDRRRAIEVKVMEERERLEEENEQVEEELRALDKKRGGKGEGENEEEEKKRVLSEEEIDERCEILRERLVKEMEAEDKRREEGGGLERPRGGIDDRDRRKGRFGGGGGGRDGPPKERRQFKSYQVHELAEAKIEESERLRKALGIKEDRETGEISSRRGEMHGRRREREP